MKQEVCNFVEEEMKLGMEAKCLGKLIALNYTQQKYRKRLGNGEQHFRNYRCQFGTAGWNAGQLEHEINKNEVFVKKKKEVKCENEQDNSKETIGGAAKLMESLR